MSKHKRPEKRQALAAAVLKAEVGVLENEISKTGVVGIGGTGSGNKTKGNTNKFSKSLAAGLGAGIGGFGGHGMTSLPTQINKKEKD